jgi:hypothetical protein
VTGQASGIVVLDIDLPDGPTSLAQLQSDHDTLPATLTQRTGSGGWQLVFTRPYGGMRNRGRDGARHRSSALTTQQAMADVVAELDDRIVAPAPPSTTTAPAATSTATGIEMVSPPFQSHDFE